MHTIEKQVETLRQSQEAGKSTQILTTWLGEAFRWILLFPVLRLVASVRVYGTENLQGAGPYILAANHSSHMDTPLLLAALPLRLRLQVRVAAAADYFFTKHWKCIFVKIVLNAFPFERKGAGCATSLAQAQLLLDAGYSLLIFPEGTRSRDGQLQSFKWGVGKLALTSLASVIPIWIEGAYTVLPKGSHWPHRQRVTVHFGTPLRFGLTENPIQIASTIEQQVRALAAKSLTAI